MKRGLVLGKFAPLHRGHQSLIEAALQEMDETFVLVYDAPEVTQIPLTRRAGWIRTLYPSVKVIEGHGSPTASGHDPAIMRLQEEYIMQIIPRPITHFFSSEWYGAHVSKALGAKDIRVDPTRSLFPISGTLLRDTPHEYREFVAAPVYADLVRWVVLLGAESTGKSTLTQQLAEAYSTTSMPEFGREFWELHHAPDGTLSPVQLVELAHLHRAREFSAAQNANRLLFVDTDARTTRQYARWYHNGSVEPELESMANDASTRYQLIILCSDSMPYYEDGTRNGIARRSQAQAEIREEIQSGPTPWIEVHGSIEARLRQAMSAINDLHLLEWR